MPNNDLAKLIQEVIADGKLSTAEKKRIDAAVMADRQLSVDERDQLGILLGMIANGELVVVD